MSFKDTKTKKVQTSKNGFIINNLEMKETFLADQTFLVYKCSYLEQENI